MIVCAQCLTAPEMSAVEEDDGFISYRRWSCENADCPVDLVAEAWYGREGELDLGIIDDVNRTTEFQFFNESFGGEK